jgi:penicillin amidase
VSRVLFKPDPTTGELPSTNTAPACARTTWPTLRSRASYSTGQSGLPWSKWYSTFVEDWAKVDYVPLWHDEPPMATLTLEPMK